jgi:ABC-2 type transport system permease protein
MNPRAFAVTRRVLRQFKGDKRTLALMLVAPNLILTLLALIFGGDTYAPHLAGVDLPPPLVEALELAEEDEDLRFSALGQADARGALAEGQADAIIQTTDGRIHVTFEGSDPAKNRAVQLVLIEAMQASSPLAAQTAPQLDFLHGGASMSAFDNFGPVLLGFFIFFFTFLVSGVTFVQERRSGTLERMLATPLRRHELVVGYALGFSVVVFVQASLVAVVSVYLLDMMLVGSFFWLLVITLLLATTALAIGMFISAFARSEFQVFQFIPIVIIPQVFFSGLFPLETMPAFLRTLGELLPLTYGAHAMREVMIRGSGIDVIWSDLAVLAGFTLLCLAANVLALKQYRSA